MHPISEILFGIYKALLDKGQVFFPLLDEQKNKIDCIVKTVNSSFFGPDRYPTNQDKAVAYFLLLIKDHPLTDGNKRTAVLWFEVYIQAVELELKLPEGLSLDQIAVAVEKFENITDEVHRILKFIFFADKNISVKE